MYSSLSRYLGLPAAHFVVRVAYATKNVVGCDPSDTNRGRKHHLFKNHVAKMDQQTRHVISPTPNDDPLAWAQIARVTQSRSSYHHFWVRYLL